MLDKPLTTVKGVGEKVYEQFVRAGISTVRDLIYLYPRSYDDYTRLASIADIKPGKVVIRARVEHLATRRVRRGLHITEATLVDGSGKVAAIWFNQPYRADQLKNQKAEWLVSGQFGFNGKKYQLQNPSVEQAVDATSDSPHQEARITPVYPATAGLKGHLVKKIVAEIKPLMRLVPESLPESTIRPRKLIGLADALQALHFPSSQQMIDTAKKRLGFEELFTLLLASELNKQQNSLVEGYAIPFRRDDAAKFVAQLPFELTDDQRRAIWQIITDIQSSRPMNRLLQGDVGSGKTVVAAMTASLIAKQGYQTAVLAPTEILATQHAETISKLVSPLGIRVGLLTGSVKGPARTQLYKSIAEGGVDIVIGTHAILQQKVVYKKLGYVVIDEQHRFGVKQRQDLLDKAHVMPHVLSMTATPIPRSLALTVYGELDVTVLKQKPKNRQPIKTSIVSPNSRDVMYAQVSAQLEQGRQVYVVCPLIDLSELSEKKSVEMEYKKLRQSIFKKWRIATLHGQMSSDEKQAVMKQYAAHEIDVLVTTTVIEVGIDVPNATVMIIENADQFGLAQAHQLRGRVGRGQHESYCYLVSSDSLKPTRRMRELANSDDGFYLAEVDLEMRGPGEIYGRAQHGQLNLKMANISDTGLISEAQKAVKDFLESGEDLLQYRELYKNVQKYQRITTLN